MRDNLNSISRAIVPILFSALAAGVFSFAQSLAAQGGLCPPPISNIGETSLLGGLIKASHSAFAWFRHGILT